MFLFSDELGHHLKDSGASYIYAIGDLLPTVKEAVEDVPNIKVSIIHLNISIFRYNTIELI